MEYFECLNKNQLKRGALEIIKNIKKSFINKDGLISLTYPPTKNNLIADFDDFVPFFLYFGEANFISSQINIASKFTYHGLVTFNDKAVSYRCDEYLGALLAYYRHTNDSFAYGLLEETLGGIENLLIRKGFLCSYYNIKQKKTPLITSPRTGAVLEVLFESGDIFPEVKEQALKIVDNWITLPFFKKYGLFPSKYYVNNHLFNTLFEKSEVLTRGSFYNKYFGDGFYYYSGWKANVANFLYKLPVGDKVQVMKDNTNFIFCLIAAYMDTNDEKYKDAILLWVDGIKKTLFKNGFVFKFWNPKSMAKEIELSQNFSVIDILCDVYCFIDKNEQYIKFAEEIAQSWIRTRWNNGLFPRSPALPFNHLDEQTDFCVSLMRLYEITNKQRYCDIAEETIASILKYHYTPKGYVGSVNNQGVVVNAGISPKYNALLLKALVLFIDGRKIYGSKYIHELMKDR